MRRPATAVIAALAISVVVAGTAWAAAVCQDNLSCNDVAAGIGPFRNTYSYAPAHGLQAFSLYSTGVSCTATENAVEGLTSASGTSGVYGESNSCYGFGVAGRSTSTSPLCSPRGVGVLGVVSSATSVWAGIFTYHVSVLGDVNVSGSKNFRIDHPLWPAKQYLVHAAVESDEPKNIYRGSVVLDNQGRAKVLLPEYFQALNRDYRYQLTSVGIAAEAFVLKEIEGNMFWIGGSRPGARVSWQVTGIRNDERLRRKEFLTVRNGPPVPPGFNVEGNQ